MIFGGTEVPSHTRMLTEMGVKNMALSYLGLARRVKFVKPWIVAEKYEPGVSVFLDSGTYTLNGKTDLGEEEVSALAGNYWDFVTSNIDAVDMVSEFDALLLGQDWVEYQRRERYDHLPREKFMPIWHPEWWDVKYLQAMAEKYELIGIPSTSFNNRNLAPVLNALAAQGTHLHGVAMTKIEIMKDIRWGSVASTSWISPAQFSDTIVWTGKELKRYPKKYKDEARKRHRTWFTQNGFDADKIADPEDKTEVLRLSIWSWLKFEEYVNSHQNTGINPGIRPTHPFSDSTAPNADPSTDLVVQPTSEEGNELATVQVRDTVNLPIIGFSTPVDDKGEEGTPVLNIRGKSARVCNTCFLAKKCPMYEPDSTCAYDIPITVRTREDRKNLQYGMLEMQTQRVLFMKFTEDIEGGYADPNTSKEMGLLQRMLDDVSKMEQEGFDVSLRVRGSGQQAEGGLISRMFGDNAAQKIMQIEEGPIVADNIIEAEILEERSEDE